MAYPQIDKKADKLVPRHRVAVSLIDRVIDPSHALYDDRVHEPADPWLVDKIRAEGFTSTLLVRLDGRRYQLIDGRRRHAACLVLDEEERAAKRDAGESWENPEDGYFAWVEIRNVTDAEAFDLMIGANESAKPYTDLQRARLIQRAIDVHGRTMAQACRPFNIPPAQGHLLVRLLCTDTTVQERVEAGTLAVNTAAVLADLPRTEQRRVVEEREAKGGKFTLDEARIAANPDGPVPQSTRSQVLRRVYTDALFWDRVRKSDRALRTLIAFWASGDRAELLNDDAARAVVEDAERAIRERL